MQEQTERLMQMAKRAEEIAGEKNESVLVSVTSYCNELRYDIYVRADGSVHVYAPFIDVVNVYLSPTGIDGLINLRVANGDQIVGAISILDDYNIVVGD